MDNVKVEKLSNGLTVITDFVPTVESVLVGLMSAVGSINENENINGISHFLEHMAFKGTATRTYTKIAEMIEDIGGDINAYTSKDHTFYYTKVLKEYLENGIDILADIIQNSVFDEVETEKEKNVILQELYNSLDTPDDIIYDYFAETAYPNQAMGRPILGTEESIKSITPSKLKQYIKENYCADKLFLIVSGNMEHNKVIELAKKYFTNLIPAGNCAIPKSKYNGGYFKKQKDLEQIHLMIGFESSNTTDRKKLFAENVLNNVLGGGMSSRLFQEVREKQNLVYTIYSAMNNFRDTGCMYIYTSTDTEKINKVIDATSKEILKVCENGITEKELERAKVSYKASLLMGLESTSVRMRMLGRQMQHYGKLIPISENVELIDSISLQDIIMTANRVFSSTPTVTYLGNVSDVYDMDTIKSKLLK
ncbi:insulinase family protein [bacterium]|nr:insulinase family protein [bacterium]